MSRTTIARYLDLDGAPEADAAGAYDLPAMATHIRENGTRLLEGDPIKLLRARKLLAECIKIESESAISTKKAVSVDVVKRFVLTYNRTLCAHVYNSCEYVLPPKLEGLGVIECRRILTRWADELVEQMSATVFSSDNEALRELDLACGGTGQPEEPAAADKLT